MRPEQRIIEVSSVKIYEESLGNPLVWFLIIIVLAFVLAGLYIAKR